MHMCMCMHMHMCMHMCMCMCMCKCISLGGRAPGPSPSPAVLQAKSVLLDHFSRHSSDRSYGSERSSERKHGSERENGSEQLSTIPTPSRFRPSPPLDNPPNRLRTPPEVPVAVETGVRKEVLAARAVTAGKAWRTGKSVKAAARAEIRKEEAAAVPVGVMAAARVEARVEARGKEALGEATKGKDAAKAAQQPPPMAVEPRKAAGAPYIGFGGEVDAGDEDEGDDGDDGDEEDGDDDDGDGQDGHDNAQRSRLEEEALGR